MVMFVTGLISPQVSSDPLVQPRGDTGVLPFHWWGIQAQAILSWSGRSRGQYDPVSSVTMSLQTYGFNIALCVLVQFWLMKAQHHLTVSFMSGPHRADLKLLAGTVISPERQQETDCFQTGHIQFLMTLRNAWWCRLLVGHQLEATFSSLPCGLLHETSCIF